MPVEYTLAELARRCGGELRGDGDTHIHGVATIQRAVAGSIAFLANPHYRRYLRETHASAVILAPADAGACRIPALVTSNPYLLYARVAAVLTPAAPVRKGVEAGASVHPTARISMDAWIGPGAVVEEGVVIEGGVSVGPNCVIMANVHVEEHSCLVAGVTLCHGVHVGKRALLHPGAVIGADGFGIANDDGVWLKVPQLGSVVVGDDVEIGANTTIDRGALEDTVIGNGVKLDNQIQVGHNVRIGEHTAIAGCTAIAGSATIGRRCMIAGGAGIIGHIEICDDVTVTAMTLVTHSIREPGAYSGSMPMDAAAQWRKNSVRFRQLDELARRLATIEKKLKD
ncbi:MAG: UDP-3-O-(3-hydroxymyristoyl)glucosamine N-acyltransferase [Gammaproteobacteria bacterium]